MQITIISRIARSTINPHSMISSITLSSRVHSVLHLLAPVVAQVNTASPIHSLSSMLFSRTCSDNSTTPSLVAARHHLDSTPLHRSTEWAPLSLGVCRHSHIRCWVRHHFLRDHHSSLRKPYLRRAAAQAISTFHKAKPLEPLMVSRKVFGSA